MKVIGRLHERWAMLRYRNARRGSWQWLVMEEARYGGMISGVPRQKVSARDPRNPLELQRGGMIGGDRMSGVHHGYGRTYAKYLSPLVDSGRRVTLVELGVLAGSGLAIWSDLFPNGRIVGLDIDLSNIRANMDRLRSRGAFVNNNLELHEFDQLEDNRDLIKQILQGDTIDVMIDDGLHSVEGILCLLDSVRACLSDDFVYFIEDNASVSKRLLGGYPDFLVDSVGEMTVLRPARPKP